MRISESALYLGVIMRLEKKKIEKLEGLRQQLDELLKDESRLKTNEALNLSKELDELIADCYVGVKLNKD